MSGHSKWKNIMHKKEKTDAQRAKIFTKIGKEIAIAVREGGADPTSNGKLRDLIAKAKANNVPNDNIERTLKKASGEDGTVYNINADTAAARIAAEMKAPSLILLTDIKGLLEDKDDENTIIRTVGVSEVPYLKKQGIISGGMIPKIDCCVEAVRRGVKQANIIDGRIPHSILIELLTDIGAGTMIIA